MVATTVTRKQTGQHDTDVDNEQGKDAVELSIVMPCLNESRTLPVCIGKAQRFMAEYGVVGEIVVADNGSTDGSQKLAADLGARVVHVKAKGYGAALAGGIEAARGEYVIMGDSDDSYDFSALAPFVGELRQGYDLVMGNRFAGGIADRAMPPMHRYFGNPVLSFIGRLFFKSRCGDFYCGLRGFRKDAYERMKLQSSGMEFALEMLVKATMFGMKVTEVPTTLSPDGRGREPHLRRWRDGWRSLRFYLLFSPRWLFWYPGLALIVFGLAMAAWLAPGSRSVLGVTLDLTTLVFAAAAVMVGGQAVLFGVFAKMLAIRMGLHPPNPRLEQRLGRATLEGGLIVGGGLIVLGVIGAAVVTGQWFVSGFGDMDPTQTLRLAIPATLAAVLGMQLSFAAFYLGFIDVVGRGRAG
ncbi:glycosyltransferase family 2 protein [Phycisphaerales bacterium AB-hyl4]|uniref:Glycosyltransferase family 2 protein n=1 Tax=Natronomicrosphaera hydrolytica TaxID=3242702 RepID=A0ABV4U7C4_9BACT